MQTLAAVGAQEGSVRLLVVPGLVGVVTRNDARADAQSSAIFDAHYVRLEGATDAHSMRLNARSVRRTRNHPGSAHAT